ncbi:MAG: hypothetical protein FJ216_10525, partial [Ignavibacteria bacterium]|nr:hypothetical protein [Ignavibacteria bacterium]
MMLFGKLLDNKGLTDIPQGVAHFYEKEGEELFNKFMFDGLIFIFDKTNNNYTLYSDKMGLEDVYYYYDGKIFAFCNLIGPLARVFSKKFDSVGIMNYAATGAVLGPVTLFDNIKSLIPAHKLEIIRNGKLVSNLNPQQYWQLPKPRKPESLSQDSLEKYFADYYLKAIERRIDKEVNVFLSGGLDSSSIVSAAKNNFGSKVNAFNYRIKGYSPQYVESHIIEKFHRDFGFNLNFVEVDNLGEQEYNLWKEFNKFSPNYFGIGTLILQNSLDKYFKNNNSNYPFLTGETADTVIDFWCGVKGNG